MQHNGGLSKPNNMTMVQLEHLALPAVNSS